MPFQEVLPGAGASEAGQVEWRKRKRAGRGIAAAEEGFIPALLFIKYSIFLYVALLQEKRALWPLRGDRMHLCSVECEVPLPGRPGRNKGFAKTSGFAASDVSELGNVAQPKLRDTCMTNYHNSSVNYLYRVKWNCSNDDICSW